MQLFLQINSRMTTYLKLHLQVDSANCQPLNHVKVVADDNLTISLINRALLIVIEDYMRKRNLFGSRKRTPHDTNILKFTLITD